MSTLPVPGIRRDGSWRNWGDSARATPSGLARPADVDALCALLETAARTQDRIKVVGGAHSFTALAATDGTLVSLDAIQGIISVDVASGRVRMYGGTRLHTLAGLLEPYSLALPNMGDIDRQSIAGAISTSTHGTGLAFTGFSGIVTALTLALPGGRLVSCNRDENPLLFQAARVGIGAMGVIVDVTIQCVERFKLRAVEAPEPLAGMLESFVERSATADHLEFYWFPYSQTALAKTNTRLPDSTPPAPLPRVSKLLDDEVLGNGLFGMLCRAGSLLPSAIPPINRLAARALSARDYTAQSNEVFVSPRRVRFREMEYAMPLGAFEQVFDELRRAIESYREPISFPVEVRTASGDDTWLGTASGRDSVYIAVHRYVGEAAGDFFRHVEKVFIAHGGRPHWGKLHTRDASYLREAYPHFDDFLAQREAVDPDGILLNGHLREMLGL